MKTETAADERYRAPALDKGLDILEYLSGQPNGLTRGEIVKAIGRSPSEIYRMLERLVARNYVSRSLEGDRYAITMKLFVLGSQHPPIRRLVARALPLMDAFAETTLQSVHLVAPDQGNAVVVAQASGPANWEFRLRVGAQLDMLTTGSGQTLLAFQSTEGRNETLAVWQRTDKPQRLAELKPVLEEVRAKGYRIGNSLQLAGVKDISVPVLSRSGGAIGVLTCPYLQRVDRINAPDAETTLNHLVQLAKELAVD